MNPIYKPARIRWHGNISYSYLDWASTEDRARTDSCGDKRPGVFWCVYRGALPSDWTVPDGSLEFMEGDCLTVAQARTVCPRRFSKTWEWSAEEIAGWVTEKEAQHAADKWNARQSKTT
jgi:hypothetical protein